MHDWTERPLAAPAFQIETIRRQKRLNINPKNSGVFGTKDGTQ